MSANEGPLMDAGGAGGQLRRGIVAQARAAILPEVRRLIDESIGRIAVRANGNLAAIGIRSALMFDPAATAVVDDPDHEQVIVPLASGGGSDFTHIQRITIASDGDPLSFSAIPATYAHLLILGNAKVIGSTGGLVSLVGRFNSDAGANYVWDDISNDLSPSTTGNASGSGTSGATSMRLGRVINSGSGIDAGSYTMVRIQINNYANTALWKAVFSETTSLTSVSTPSVSRHTSGWWASIDAIDEITLFQLNGLEFKAGTVLDLYGFGAS